MMMSERGYVEKPILDWLAGAADQPDDHGLGWTYCSPLDMEAHGRPQDNPIVETLLIPAIQRINPAVKTEAQARLAVAALQSMIHHPDSLEANRRCLDALRDGISLMLNPGQPATTVYLIDLNPDHLAQNQFIITDQYKVKGEKGVRADTVLLVNGIPLVTAEYKSFLDSGHDWTEGVNQVHRYLRQAPALLATNLFCVAADEQEFSYGTVDFNAKTQEEIDAQRDSWMPWLSQYPQRRLYWDLPEAERDPDRVHAAVVGLLQPGNILDFLAHFIVFETKKNHTLKKVARYQQFEAANDMVDRALEQYVKPAKAQDRTGLIWHTQGSGKSLTMIFTAYKLRRCARLHNPTVMIVVDRRDLKTQLGEDFESCDYPNVVKALGVEDLKTKIATDQRETVITTLQCFQRMEKLEPNRRDNIFLLIDEAHRSQKGKGAGFAMTMRAKLPAAFRYGLTGTPIDKTMVNTHRDFGPVLDGQQERYLSYYGIRQSILDGATLEVYYELHKVPLVVDEQPLSVGFEEMCAEMEVEDEETKDFLQRREARWKVLARDERRVKKVVTHLVDHFLKYPDPSGFKAQLVCVDRQACSIYKDALDKELQSRDLPAEWTDVIISEAQNDPPSLERFHYGKAKSDELIDYFKLTPAQWVAWNKAANGPDENKWRQPLKILIVCDRLLTGFDAPIEQVMYLDKPLRDHNLLQAMARTNRPFPRLKKRCGVIIDYFGVFQDLQKALNFDERVCEEAVIQWDRLKAQFPIELQRCLEMFKGIKIEDTRACLLSSLQRLSDKLNAQSFETQFRRTEVLWEALSPDESLYPYRHEYHWLCGIYLAHMRRQRRSETSLEELAAKTRQLIQQNTTILEIVDGLPVYKIDANYLAKVNELPTPADRAAELEAALNKELAEGGGFQYRKLGERLKEIISNKDASDYAAEKYLKELAGLVTEVETVRSEPDRLGLDAHEYALFTVARSFAKITDDALCVIAAKTMVAELRRQKFLPVGWADNTGGRKKVRLTLQVQAWGTEIEPLGLCPAEEENSSPFLDTALEELARVGDL